MSKTQALLALGREMLDWIDAPGWLDALLPNLTAPWIAAVEVPARPSELEADFLNAPWELLADDQGHLAADLGLRWCPVRRLGPPATPARPSPYRLSLVFMAAQPPGQTLLDFEAEEAAILDATEGSGLDLRVEESGEFGQLADTLSHEQAAANTPVDVLHISCHGGFDRTEPALFLETETGGADPVDVVRIVAEPALTGCRLLFLSACHTAAGETSMAPLTQQLLRAGVPAVLGWGGAVSDVEASRFAATLYRHLSQHQDLTLALSAARFELLSPTTEQSTALTAGFMINTYKINCIPRGNGFIAPYRPGYPDGRHTRRTKTR